MSIHMRYSGGKREKCYSCHFFKLIPDETFEDDGECHRNPPVAGKGRPSTGLNDTCCEWGEKEGVFEEYYAWAGPKMDKKWSDFLEMKYGDVRSCLKSTSRR